MVPGRGQQHPLAALTAGETVYLLDPREEEPRMLHSVYGHPVTCLDASDSQVAFGVKRTDWLMHDGGNKVGLASLHRYRAILTKNCRAEACWYAAEMGPISLCFVVLEYLKPMCSFKKKKGALLLLLKVLFLSISCNPVAHFSQKTSQKNLCQ